MLSTTGTRVLTGCDLQRVEEVEEAVRDFGQRYLERVYTVAERDGYRTGGASSLAGRFAAKEAVLKLVGRPDGIDPRSVEIGVDQHGRPRVHLTGAAATLAEKTLLGPIDVSVSHAGGWAMAVAVAVARDDGAGSTVEHPASDPGPDPAPDPGQEEPDE